MNDEGKSSREIVEDYILRLRRTPQEQIPNPKPKNDENESGALGLEDTSVNTKYGPFPYVVFALLVLTPFYNGLSGFKFVIYQGGKLLGAYFIALILFAGISFYHWHSRLKDENKIGPKMRVMKNWCVKNSDKTESRVSQLEDGCVSSAYFYFLLICFLLIVYVAVI